MTARITKATIESNAYSNIWSIVDNRTYVKDPRHPNSTNKDREFVYESDPFHKAITFKGLPYIILEFPRMEYSAESVDNTVKNVEWTQTITVRVARDGSSNTRSNVGSTDLLAIGDDLNETFNNETVGSLLNQANIYHLRLTKISVETVSIQMKEMYEAVYELTYYTRLVVG